MATRRRGLRGRRRAKSSDVVFRSSPRTSGQLVIVPEQLTSLLPVFFFFSDLKVMMAMAVLTPHTSCAQVRVGQFSSGE